jgi:hypothetical protein
VLLGRLVRHRRIHLDTVLLQPGGGDPLALVERAVQLMGRRVSRRDNYSAKAILLDFDGCGQSHDRDRCAHALAKEHELRLIWQEPCHEGLLLRHLDGCDAFRPATSDQALADLQRHWPEYRKRLRRLHDSRCASMRTACVARPPSNSLCRPSLWKSSLNATKSAADADHKLAGA